MALTDTFVRNVKPSEKVQKISDGGGMHLRVEPRGSKLWRMQYSFAGKQKTLALGVYPAISLAEARKKRDQAKGLLAAGLDPSAEAKLEKIRRAEGAANTFAAIADELITKDEKEGRADATLVKKRWIVDMVRSDIGSRPIAQITPAEILQCLRKVERAGNYETARRMRATIGQVFRYAIATARAESDPTLALRGALTAPTVTHRAAILDKKAFGGLLRAIWTYDGQPETKAALQLLTYLYPRPGELRQAEWKEFDLDAGTWIIPASRTKMRREHRKFLPEQVVTILRYLHGMTGDGALLFPSVRSRKKPISDNTTNAALRRMGFRQEEVSSHGFRASASTMLNESGKWSSDAIERELAHADQSEVRRAYHRGDHWDERVRMQKWWADAVDRMRNEGVGHGGA
ncbi:integrase arm-type DNA-binding domain-containing protein [Mesorhizobium sp. KR1-2]|uniref:tyrosine-type recombinase/integrase n=1 Tax=Mesorhizobium sp. KR1-2 TaxID=3156609 RepID=UPI0032B3CE16